MYTVNFPYNEDARDQEFGKLQTHKTLRTVAFHLSICPLEDTAFV